MKGRHITRNDEQELHKQLGLSSLEPKPRRHLSKMMYDLKFRKPDLITGSKSTMFVCSNTRIQFEEDRINYEIYGKSPYIQGIELLKQLT